MTFDGSAIDGFSRVQEADVLARPDPKTFQLLPWHHDDAQVARVFCDIANLDGTPFEGDPRHALRRTLERARAAGYTFFASPEVEYFYFADADPERGPVTPRLRLVLRPLCGRPDQQPAPAVGAHARGDGHPRRAHPARGRTQPARDRPALHRRPHHGRHRHDDADGDQGDGPPRGRLRLLHAQAASGRPGLGHAHPPLALGGRAQRVRRRSGPLRALRGGAPLHRGPLAPRPRDHRRDQPVGQLLQAPHRRVRGAGPRQLGAQQPLGARAGPRRQDGQDRVDPAGVPGTRQRRATRTWPSR